MATAFPPSTCNPDTLLKDYPCLQCLDEKQLWAALILILSSICNEGTPSTADELVAASPCWPCYNDKQLMQILISKLAGYAVDNGWLVAGDVADVAGCIVCIDSIHKLKAIALAQFCCMIEGLPAEVL